MKQKEQQNQSLYRPFPGEIPQITKHDQLFLNSNCKCSACSNFQEPLDPQIQIDHELNLLKQKAPKSKSKSDYIYFLDELYKGSGITYLNFPILDTIIFTSQGSVKYITFRDTKKLRMERLSMPLRSFLSERKYLNDLDYQKKKYQRNNLGFQFTQLDHQSEKLIKQFENNIKYMNALLNRVVSIKERNKDSQEVISQYQLNTIFSRISRKIMDFSQFQYIKIFPIMYGEEESSYTKTIKYFKARQRQNKNYKLAEHYVSCWFDKNETLQKMQEQFLNQLKQNQNDLLFYYTYKICIYFEKLSNKQIESAIITYTTIDEGHSFFFSHIESMKLQQLQVVAEKTEELPRKLTNCEPEHYIKLTPQMTKTFQTFQFEYSRLDMERQNMEDKFEKDRQFSNMVYESVTNDKVQKGQNGETIYFIKQAFPAEKFLKMQGKKMKKQISLIQ